MQATHPPVPAPGRHVWRFFVFVLCGFALLIWTAPAMAANPVEAVFQAFENVTNNMTTQVGQALNSAQIEQVVNVLFTAMGLGLFVFRFAGMALRGFDLLDIMELVLTIFFVYIVMISYKTLIPQMYGAGRFISDILGNGLIQGNGGSLGLQIFSMLFNLTFTPDCDLFECLGTHILAIPATIVAWAMCILLGILAGLVEMWILWGFMIAYAIGYVLVPFMLYERLAFLFDGWLKFFFGMIIYTIVAKVNLALVLLGLQIMTQNAGDANVPVRGFFDVLGLFVFVTVGICTLFRTSSFAAAIVMGAGGNGISGMAQTAARMTASAMSGGAGAIGGAIGGGK